MNLYIFSPHDQFDPTWLIHLEKQGELGFFPKARYERFICKKCGKFWHDEIFQEGFPEDFQLMAKEDIVHTDDGFYCVNNRFLELVEANRWQGLSTKPIGATGWHVLNLLIRFDIRGSVFKTVRGPCSDCGRLREVIGSVHHLGQLASLPQSECFFSTVANRDATGLMDRNLFATEGIVNLLKKNKIKGGVFSLLHTQEVYAELLPIWQRDGKVKLPKGSKIIL